MAEDYTKPRYPQDAPVYSPELLESTPVSGSTPFEFYDSDETFCIDAKKAAKFIAYRLGWPLMDVELTPKNMYACFEEAVTTYGNQVYAYKVRENYLSLEGSLSQGSGTANSTVIEPTLQRIVEISQNYGTEADVGGNVPLHHARIKVREGVQEYDLLDPDIWDSEDGVDLSGGIEIRKVFWEAPPAILRYFDPYAGTGTGIQSLMDAFDFGSYSPGVNFLMMPISFDILKVQAIEFNDQVRRSAYSFRLNNNKLQIFPIPPRSGRMRLEYYRLDDKRKLSSIYSPGSSSSSSVTNSPISGTGVITNISEVPYSNPNYSEINSIGRQWIFRYALALCKEVLGYVRGKYTTLPIPDSEATLNQADLLADARTEKQDLLKELNDLLETTSRGSQLQRKAEEAENLRAVLSGVPYGIWVG